MPYSIVDFTELVYSNDLKPKEEASQCLNHNLFKPPENDTTYFFYTEVHND